LFGNSIQGVIALSCPYMLLHKLYGCKRLLIKVTESVETDLMKFKFHCRTWNLATLW